MVFKKSIVWKNKKGSRRMEEMKNKENASDDEAMVFDHVKIVPLERGCFRLFVNGVEEKSVKNITIEIDADRPERYPIVTIEKYAEQIEGFDVKECVVKKPQHMKYSRAYFEALQIEGVKNVLIGTPEKGIVNVYLVPEDTSKPNETIDRFLEKIGYKDSFFLPQINIVVLSPILEHMVLK
jgi:hypothetical protein